MKKRRMDDKMIMGLVASLCCAAIMGLVKLYGNFTALRASHIALQDEVNELKHDVKTDFDKIAVQIEKISDKIDSRFDRVDDMFQQRRSGDIEQRS